MISDLEGKIHTVTYGLLIVGFQGTEVIVGGKAHVKHVAHEVWSLLFIVMLNTALKNWLPQREGDPHIHQ